MNKRLEKLRADAERLRYDAQDRGLVQSEYDALTAVGDLAQVVRDLIYTMSRHEESDGAVKVRYVSIHVIFVRPVLQAIFKAGGEVITVLEPEWDRRLCPIWFRAAVDEGAILSLALPEIMEELHKREAGLSQDSLPPEVSRQFEDINQRLRRCGF